MENVLVTGGAGYIGSHVCKALSQAGFRPVVYDDLSNGHRESVRWGPLEVGDLADEIRLEACLRKHQPGSVIHLAGFIAAGESVTDPEKYYENNLRGLLVLSNGMRRHRIERIVFSSSAAVYGAPEVIPIPEDAPILPVNPYGQTKAMSEQILVDYAAAYGFRVVSLRYFNAAGADPDGELGELHEPETHLIPLVLQAAAGLRPHIDIFGDQYPTPDGTCVRDYIHVSDLAAAHVLSLQRLAQRAAGAEAYNLGNGQGFSVLEVIRAAERVTGRSIPVRFRPARAGDPPVLLANSQRARNELDWRPRFDDLASQLSHAWTWQLSRNRTPAQQPRAKIEALSTD
jgi:UDP-arabinose 4-epimerase